MLDVKKEYIKLFLLCVFIVLFVAGLWNIDIGASAQFMKLSGVDVRIEGLFVVGAEPRVTYHLGMLMSLISLLSITAISIWEVIR